MRIALDAMGSDGHPATEVAGVVSALRALGDDVRFALVGDQDSIAAELRRRGFLGDPRVDVVHAPERVSGGESPAAAVRRKPNSSIAVGLRLQKEGSADAFVSAGSTGAVMASSLLTLRPLPGVDRPAIGTILPTAREPVLMLDAGANVDCKASQLVQFARLGNIYAEDLFGREDPRVGLLNIGEEPEKGDEASVEAHRLLVESSLNFVGNVEGRDLIQGAVDVIVCDGFVGNVVLKFYESVAQFIIQLLRAEIEGAEQKASLRDLFRVLDYAEYGGAPLLGVNGVSIICHGKSPPRAIGNALRVAAQVVRSSMVQHIARELASDDQHGGERP